MSGARVRHTAVIVALAAALTACTGSGTGPEEGAGPSSDEERLARLPGMSAASIELRSVEEDVEVTQVAVDAEPGATAEEISAVVGEVLGHEEEYAAGENAPVAGVVYLDAGTTEWIDPDFPAADQAVPSGVWWGVREGAQVKDSATIEERAAWLVEAAGLVPDATVVVDHDQDLKIRVADYDPARVGELATAVLGSDVLAGAPAILSVGDWERVPGHDPVAVLAGNPLSPELVAAWDAFSSSIERAPDADVRELSLGPVVTGELDPTLAPGVVNGVTTIRLPGVVPPRQLTSRQYGDRLLPMLRAQLDVVGAAGQGSTLEVFNEFRGSPGAEPGEADLFLAARTGSPAEPDDLGRGWNADASAYLAGR